MMSNGQSDHVTACFVQPKGKKKKRKEKLKGNQLILMKQRKVSKY